MRGETIGKELVPRVLTDEVALVLDGIPTAVYVPDEGPTAGLLLLDEVAIATLGIDEGPTPILVAEVVV
jgi:hypothetical protein